MFLITWCKFFLAVKDDRLRKQRAVPRQLDLVRLGTGAGQALPKSRTQPETAQRFPSRGDCTANRSDTVGI